MKIIKSILFIATVIVFVSCENKPEKKPFKKGEFKEWAKTPPMGWNSWDCYGPTVKEQEIISNADYMAENLKSM